MQFTTVKIEKPEEINFIFGQTHFIKSVEDIHEALVSAVPGHQVWNGLLRGLRQMPGPMVGDRSRHDRTCPQKRTSHFRRS